MYYLLLLGLLLVVQLSLLGVQLIYPNDKRIMMASIIVSFVLAVLFVRVNKFLSILILAETATLLYLYLNESDNQKVFIISNLVISSLIFGLVVFALATGETGTIEESISFIVPSKRASVCTSRKSGSYCKLESDYSKIPELREPEYTKMPDSPAGSAIASSRASATKN